MAKAGFEPKLALGPFTRADLLVLVVVLLTLGALLVPLRAQFIASANHAAEMQRPSHPSPMRPARLQDW